MDDISNSITMKPYIKAQYYMITTIPLCDNYFLVVIINLIAQNFAHPNILVEKTSADGDNNLFLLVRW